eukprot:12529713-Alexandrium_andersonii.AAC.1
MRHVHTDHLAPDPRRPLAGREPARGYPVSASRLRRSQHCQSGTGARATRSPNPAIPETEQNRS